MDTTENKSEIALRSDFRLLQSAIEKGYTPELIEKMMILQERYDKERARKEFLTAKARFWESPPIIWKDKENTQFSRGDKKAMYTSIGNLLSVVPPALAKHGLTTSFNISQKETKEIVVSCTLSHTGGYEVTVSVAAPPDTSGGNAKNFIQQNKSTITYLKCITFESVVGLAATDDANLDDDGNSSSSISYITADQLTEITDLLSYTKSDTRKFLDHLKAESLEKIHAEKYTLALTALKAKMEMLDAKN